ncbi:MAG: hypothetical protein JST54_03235 [Deltaproteobacteria bacterium]|nr:hypothetical protein [Deltaproteobacteria bacterium]
MRLIPATEPAAAPAPPDAPVDQRPLPLKRPVHIALGLVAPAALLVLNMVRAAPLTIDDSYISFRYARNLAHGLGLVYNAGERIEGYTNFLWTLLMAAAIKLGLDPVVTAKLLGGAAALGALVVVWRLSERLLPFRWAPAMATWLLASSMGFAGYAVLGLETLLFTFLLLLGLWLLARELDAPERFPLSGIAYALAGLTRPEAPLFLGMAMLLLGKRMLARQNLIRAAIFAGVVGAHLLWRHSYYGAWLPNTFSAKTGDLHDQSIRGVEYVLGWVDKAGAVFWFALLGATLAVAKRNWLALTAGATALATVIYVIVVGGDWMPVFRFLVPFEPFAFLLVDYGLRSAFESRSRAVLVALTLFCVGTGLARERVDREQTLEILSTKHDWDQAAGSLVSWFEQTNRPGTVAIGDIGYVGWATDYPVLDILGLVDPVIARLPGGMFVKQGPQYLDYFFTRMPEYFILISSMGDCDHPFHPAIAAVYRDPQGRLKANYQVVQRLPLGTGGLGWCVYARKEQP